MKAAKSKKAEKPRDVQAFDIAQEHNMGVLLEKNGFEAYQHFRAFFAAMLTDPNKGKLFISDSFQSGLENSFQLCDQAYIDNFNLSLTLKIKNPEIYEETIAIIDKYVRPEPRNEGLNYLYQECGGFLALVLHHYEGVSARQAIHAAAQLTKYSESTIEKSYRGRMLKVKDKLPQKIPPLIALCALYWTLHYKGANPEKLKPFKARSSRSESEINKVKAAYFSFTAKVIRHCQTQVLQHLKTKPLVIIEKLANEMAIQFPLPEIEIQRAGALPALYIICAAYVLETIPAVVERYDAQARVVA